LPRFCLSTILSAYVQGINQQENFQMNAIKKVIVSAAVFAALGSAILGCNTMKGAGKDVERGGEKIQGAADGAQHN